MHAEVATVSSSAHGIVDRATPSDRKAVIGYCAGPGGANNLSWDIVAAVLAVATCDAVLLGSCVLLDGSQYERLAHLPRGFGHVAVAAHDAWVSLVELEVAIAHTPNPMHPRDDVPTLVALGLTWPEERQRLRHALENVVHAVKGDAGRHLQRLQRYLAHLEAKSLGEEDAAAMFDALQLPPEADADAARPLKPVALQRAAELRRCLDTIGTCPVPPPAGVVVNSTQTTPRMSGRASFGALGVAAIVSSVAAGVVALVLLRALKLSPRAAWPKLLLAVGRVSHSFVLHSSQPLLKGYGYVAAAPGTPSVEQAEEEEEEEQDDQPHIAAPARELAARLGALRRAGAAVSDERCPRGGDSAIELTEPSAARGAIATAAASLQSLLDKL